MKVHLNSFISFSNIFFLLNFSWADIVILDSFYGRRLFVHILNKRTNRPNTLLIYNYPLKNIILLIYPQRSVIKHTQIFIIVSHAFWNKGCNLQLVQGLKTEIEEVSHENFYAANKSTFWNFLLPKEIKNSFHKNRYFSKIMNRIN